MVENYNLDAQRRAEWLGNDNRKTMKKQQFNDKLKHNKMPVICPVHLQRFVYARHGRELMG